MSPPREPSTPQAAHHALVVELLADELRRWLRHGPCADLLPEVPEGGSLAARLNRACR